MSHFATQVSLISHCGLKAVYYQKEISLVNILSYYKDLLSLLGLLKLKYVSEILLDRSIIILQSFITL